MRSALVLGEEDVGADLMVGGYGAGSGQSDLSYIVNDNDNSFIGITIQYRVRLGVPNSEGGIR